MLKPAFETSSLVPANRPRERRRAGRREAALRKHRIFARLAEGRSHAAIAREAKLFAPVDQKNYR